MKSTRNGSLYAALPCHDETGYSNMGTKNARTRTFDPQRFLNSAGAARKVATYQRSDIIFAQGDPCPSVMYIHTGAVKLSVLSKTGKEAVVAMLGPGDFPR